MPTPEKDWQALLQKPLPVSSIFWPSAKASVPSFMVHLEQHESHINGNKGFKALPNLVAAKAAGFNQIVSFGGRHSNHLHALAAACNRYGLKLVAVVRGYPEQAITPTLKALQNAGASIYFVGNGDYKKRYHDDFIEGLLQRVGKSWVIPEGGNNEYGQQGAKALAKKLAALVNEGDYIGVAVGTGTTLAGLLEEPSLKGVNILAVPVLHNVKALKKRFAGFANCQIISGFEGAGFAKISPELAQFIVRFEALQKITLDPIYTCKLLQGIEQLHRQGYFNKGQRVFCLHTGGLQGRQAMQKTIDKHAPTGATV